MKPTFSFKRAARARCAQCAGCQWKTDCGVCRECRDKISFGGSGLRKKICRARVCLNLQPRNTHSARLANDRGQQSVAGWQQHLAAQPPPALAPNPSPADLAALASTYSAAVAAYPCAPFAILENGYPAPHHIVAGVLAGAYLPTVTTHIGYAPTPAAPPLPAHGGCTVMSPNLPQCGRADASRRGVRGEGGARAPHRKGARDLECGGGADQGAWRRGQRLRRNKAGLCSGGGNEHGR